MQNETKNDPTWVEVLEIVSAQQPTQEESDKPLSDDERLAYYQQEQEREIAALSE